MTGIDRIKAREAEKKKKEDEDEAKRKEAANPGAINEAEAQKKK